MSNIFEKVSSSDKLQSKGTLQIVSNFTSVLFYFLTKSLKYHLRSILLTSNYGRGLSMCQYNNLSFDP